jgi:hypothetical protein
MLVDIGGNHRAHGDDPKPGLAGGLQRPANKDRCQTASLEAVGDLSVQEDALAVAVGELGEADALSLDGDGEAVGVRR